METNRLDNSIKEKFANRTFKPSGSAWERLSAQLDEQSKQKKKGWFFYTGAAASIFLLISIAFSYFNENKVIKPLEIIVDKPIDSTSINKKMNNFFNKIPFEKALVKIEEVGGKVENHKKVFANKGKQFHPKKKISTNSKKEIKISFANVDEKSSEKKLSEIKKDALQEKPNSRIKVNSDDLLYAVAHSKEEVKAYYAKYNVNRKHVLRTIKSELQKSHININPETILAEVERTIDDDDFQNNFMKSLKRKVSDIANVIASRNN